MKKRFLGACLLSVLVFVQAFGQKGGDEQGLEAPEKFQLEADKEAVQKAYKGWWTKSQANYEERMDWYKKAKFGCFVHWGAYSEQGGIWNGHNLGGYTEHLMRRACIPLDEYKREVIKPFNPTEFNADEWMRNAKDAGMRYFIVTAKHHDGFAMFYSDAYPYDMRMTSYRGRDVMEELRLSAKKYGLKFGFYYSHAFDWECPDAPGNDWDYNNPGGDKEIGGKDWWLERKDFLPHAEKYVSEKAIPQIRELILKYDPDILWFDTPHKLPLYLNVRILEAIREIDKDSKIVINGRLARWSNKNLGDYSNTGDRAAFFPNNETVWESIPTTNESYGYSKVDTIRKSVPFFIRLITTAASKGGNILLNVGPMGNGKWDERDIRIFKGIGDWLKINGEAVYDTQKTSLPIPSWGVMTQRGDTLLYAHVYDWPEDGNLIIGGLRSKIQKAWLLADKDVEIPFHRINRNDYELALPVNAPDTVNTIIAMSLSDIKEPDSVRLLDSQHSNTLYTFDGLLCGKGLSYGDGKPNRNYVTKWVSTSQWIEWPFRLNEPAEYDLYIDYNTQNAISNYGTMRLEIADKVYKIDYSPWPEKKGIKSLYVGRIKMNAGVYQCRLKGEKYVGNQFMGAIAIRLKK